MGIQEEHQEESILTNMKRRAGGKAGSLMLYDCVVVWLYLVHSVVKHLKG